ncbi:hypothetical protein EYF80_019894 [Liparis tanakae]|uniref:Uncharacterized protein n=1 Tax=Liparis tanakae TaxID=230148 RepID=A0A4Z2HVF3_9TELE|nr:hypothetical protein EYF80_019894 [Liparis tanakae]
MKDGWTEEQQRRLEAQGEKRQSGLADFVQQLRVEALVVGGSLAHGALQRGDLLLRSAQTLLKPLNQAALVGPLGLHRLQPSQQLLMQQGQYGLQAGQLLAALLSLSVALGRLLLLVLGHSSQVFQLLSQRAQLPGFRVPLHMLSFKMRDLMSGVLQLSLETSSHRLDLPPLLFQLAGRQTWRKISNKKVLHLAIKGDPSCQDFVLFPTSQSPRCSEIAADGALEVGELAVGVHAMNYIGGVKPWEWAHHLRGRGVWVCMARRRDL